MKKVLAIFAALLISAGACIALAKPADRCLCQPCDCGATCACCDLTCAVADKECECKECGCDVCKCASGKCACNGCKKIDHVKPALPDDSLKGLSFPAEMVQMGKDVSRAAQKSAVMVDEIGGVARSISHGIDVLVSWATLAQIAFGAFLGLLVVYVLFANKVKA